MIIIYARPFYILYSSLYPRTPYIIIIIIQYNIVISWYVRAEAIYQSYCGGANRDDIVDMLSIIIIMRECFMLYRKQEEAAGWRLWRRQRRPPPPPPPSSLYSVYASYRYDASSSGPRRSSPFQESLTTTAKPVRRAYKFTDPAPRPWEFLYIAPVIFFHRFYTSLSILLCNGGKHSKKWKKKWYNI
jgi:hypothetical protein